MSDRLSEIKALFKGDTFAEGDPVLWLIAEIERLRAELDRAWRAALEQNGFEEAVMVADKHVAEIERLKAQLAATTPRDAAEKALIRRAAFGIRSCNCESLAAEPVSISWSEGPRIAD